MSDHFDHYKRPPSRDNSVDRYSRAASRLSGGSRQSSVEKQPQQLPSAAADKPYGGGSGFGAGAGGAGPKPTNSFATAAAQHPPPFEEIILRQRNLGQEIVPSPVGQPKRTESLYVNPNVARKETKPKVSTAASMAWGRSNSGGGGGGGGGGRGGIRKPRLLPPPPPLPLRRSVT